LFFERFDAVELTDAPEELVEGLLVCEGMSVWYGESNVGKTFVMLSVSHAVGSGRPWNGRAVKQGLVVYIAAEGNQSVRLRSVALRQELGPSAIAVVPCPVDLLHDNADVKPLIALIRDAETAFGQPCKLVVVDTLSRTLVGGNENAPDDMGRFIANCDRLRAGSRAHLAVVHHTGKDTTKKERGWSGLRAAADHMIAVSAGLISDDKQRDNPKNKKIPFQLRTVALGERGGKTLTSCVVDFGAAADFAATVISRPGTQMLEAFEIAEGRKEADLRGDKRVTTGEWSDTYLELTGKRAGDRGTAARTLRELRREAADAGGIEEPQEGQWMRRSGGSGDSRQSTSGAAADGDHPLGVAVPPRAAASKETTVELAG
jgi:hypothetical protein